MKPTGFVVNTDNHTKSGMHWIAIYADTADNILYFDSFGLPPLIPDHINRIRKNCKQFRWNVTRIQGDSSDVCGQYCIMFLTYMYNGLGFNKFIENFSDDFKRNDDIARRFVSLKNTNFTGNGGCIVRCLQNCSSKMSLM